MALDVELAEIRDFLARHHPFDALPPDELSGLVAELSMEYFRRGTRLIAKGDDNHHLYVVRSGAVDILDAADTLVDRGAAGTCLGAITLVSGNPSTFDVVAIEDVLALRMGAATFHRLRDRHPEFAHFFDEQRARRMRGAVAQQQLSATGSAILKTRVRSLVTRDPVVVAAGVTIREAAQAMTAAGVSSLLVLDGEDLAGIVTDRDLRNRVVAAGADPAGPVTGVMTAAPVTGSPDALAFEALLEMVARNIHHLPLLEDGRPVGVITTTDLMRLEHANPVYLAGDVSKQATPEGVAELAHRLPKVVESLVAQDASADDIGRVVTAIGDTVERRLVALAEERLGPAPVPYCWVTLGSRARHEQALAADQDNALILGDDVGPGDAAYFAAFADLVSTWLVAAGYPKCTGGVMATNPSWRLPLAGWQSVFTEWLKRPVPEAILRASIFFDMRPVAGDTRLYAALAEAVRRRAPRSKRFLTQLARHAVANEPPLGFFRGLVVERSGTHKDALDIKRGGIGAVVDLARVYALAERTPAVNTQARLAGAVAAGTIAADRGEDLRDAFEFISYVRLRHQAAQVRAGRTPDNYVLPGQLSSFDTRHLREAFAIVRSAQSTLASIYTTGALG